MEIVNTPWGTYRKMYPRVYGDVGIDIDFVVKELYIMPCQSTSLQFHNHRDEVWYIQDGYGVVEIGDTTHDAFPGRKFKVAAGTKHRITCTSNEELFIVEVWYKNGKEHLSEDDIVRLEDNYGRADGKHSS